MRMDMNLKKRIERAHAPRPHALRKQPPNLKKRIERYIYGGLFSEAELGNQQNLKKRIESSHTSSSESGKHKLTESQKEN